MEDLRAFMPKSSSSFVKILAEWTRLWKSYSPGLFSYYQFPKIVRTNTLEEQAFSVEKSKIIKRLCNKNIGFFLEIHGELYLRLVHAEIEELQAPITETIVSSIFKTLKSDFQKKISAKTELWTIKSESYSGYDSVLSKYHPNWRKIQLKKKISKT